MTDWQFRNPGRYPGPDHPDQASCTEKLSMVTNWWIHSARLTGLSWVNLLSCFHAAGLWYYYAS